MAARQSPEVFKAIVEKVRPRRVKTISRRELTEVVEHFGLTSKAPINTLRKKGLLTKVKGKRGLYKVNVHLLTEPGKSKPGKKKPGPKPRGINPKEVTRQYLKERKAELLKEKADIEQDIEAIDRLLR